MIALSVKAQQDIMPLWTMEQTSLELESEGNFILNCPDFRTQRSQCLFLSHSVCGLLLRSLNQPKQIIRRVTGRWSVHSQAPEAPVTPLSGLHPGLLVPINRLLKVLLCPQEMNLVSV
jgi:hypothetical protein